MRSALLEPDLFDCNDLGIVGALVGTGLTLAKAPMGAALIIGGAAAGTRYSWQGRFVLIRWSKDNPATSSDGLGRLSKVVLVVYLVIVSILVINVLVTEGLGKSAVGPIGALIIGIIFVIRDWRPSRSS
jgi:hypothetical protein